MLRILAILIIAFSATTAAARCDGVDLRTQLSPAKQELLRKTADKVPFGRGNHWIATKGTQKIHVIGTLHIGDGRMRSAIRRLRGVIQSADLVFFEVTSAQMAADNDEMRRYPDLFFLPKGKSLETLLSKEDWKELYYIFTVAGMEENVLRRFQPWVVSFLMQSTDCKGRGLTSVRGLDDRMERIARKAGVPVAGLEEANTGYRALSQQPLRDQIKTLQLDIKSHQSMDHQFITIREAYFDQATAEGKVMADWTMHSDLNISRAEVKRLNRSFNVQILDWRNKIWMPRILTRQEQNIVVAVGAAHLPGKNGVLNLLSAKGYKLQRAEF